MKKMPEIIKNKLRRIDKLNKESQNLQMELGLLLEEYNVPEEALLACGDYNIHTEALAFVYNAEGNIEENIADIEEVFLHYTNRGEKNE